MKILNNVILSFFFCFSALAQAQSIDAYDPLSTADLDAKINHKDISIKDSKRDRAIPIRIYLPPANFKAPYPIVLHSHGLGGSRKTKPYFAEHLARRGYLCVFLQHPGTDEDIHKGLALEEKREALKNASSVKQSLQRVKDVHRVIDELEKWQAEQDHFLFNKLKLDAIAMTGHSYGAGTTQHVSGQWNPRTENKLNDTRIKAAIIMSPAIGKQRKMDKAFGKVSTPWLLMTGSKDGSRLKALNPADRLKVYEHLPKGDKYQLVLWNGEHHAFTDTGGKNKKRNPNHHIAIKAFSTAFLDAYLKNNAKAKQWLIHEKQTQAVLETKDAWSHK